MGEPTAELQRIGLVFCVDGFTAFAYGGLSVKPAEFKIANLPPGSRACVRNMLLCMLIPAHLKGEQSRKYYDWAADFELNDLHTRGVEGVRVIVYATSLDAPGRAELLQMQNHGAIYSCPYCQINFDAGLGSKPVFGGFRRFLPAGHPWRRRTFVVHGLEFQFGTEETRSPPQRRTTTTAMECIHLATPNNPFRGHKSAPLMSKWPSFAWEMHPSDLMHDLKSVCDMLLKIMVGKGSFGMYEYWKKDDDHRLFCEATGIFPEVYAGGKLPWRLTREEVEILDARVGKIWWPHYMDVLYRDGYSFFKKSNRMWKARHKSFILLTILPTCLRGHVSAVHMGVLTIVNALRQLEGQVISKRIF